MLFVEKDRQKFAKYFPTALLLQNWTFQAKIQYNNCKIITNNYNNYKPHHKMIAKYIDLKQKSRAATASRRKLQHWPTDQTSHDFTLFRSSINRPKLKRPSPQLLLLVSCFVGVVMIISAMNNATTGNQHATNIPRVIINVFAS